MKVLSVILSLLFTYPIFAQKTKQSLLQSTSSLNQKNFSYYQFSDSSSTYLSIRTTGTSVTPTDWDDGYYYLDLTGQFAFFYNGRYVSNFSIGTNGGILVGKNANLAYANDLANATRSPVIAPLWDDLQFSDLVSDYGIYYQINTVNGQKVLTIEWYNITRINTSSQYTVSFQVKLWQDGTIELIYGDMSNAASWSASASIGCNDLEDGQIKFISITPGNPPTVTQSSANNLINGSQLASITEGTVYKLVPYYPQFDVTTIQVTPLYSIIGQEVNFNLTIKNTGKDSIVNIPVKLEIKDSNATVYSATDTVKDTLAPSQTVTIAFNSWTPSKIGVYELTAFTMLAADTLRTNDTLKERFKVYQKAINMFQGTDTVCLALFYDSGGPENNYGDRENKVLTFYPEIPGAKIKLSFSSFRTESGYDYLYVYDGENTDAPRIASLTGTQSNVEFIASNFKGVLTVAFQSDASVNYPGWTAEISCIMPPEHDLSVYKIEPDYYFPGSLYAPKVTIRNHGSHSETDFQIHLWDSLGSYDHTLTISDTINPVEEKTIPFPSWMPSSDSNALYAAVICSGDENPQNDTIKLKFYKFATIYSWVVHSSEGLDSGAIMINRLAKQFIQNGKYTGDFVAAGDVTPYGWVGLLYNSKKLVFIDTASNIIEISGSLPLYEPTGLTYNPVDKFIYIVDYKNSVDSSRLLRINPADGQLRFVGNIDEEIVIGIAADTNGHLYGIGLFRDNFFSIDTATAQATVIGPVGFNLNYAQDIGFDRYTNTLYGTLYGDQSGLYVIDVNSGNAQRIYALNSQLSCVAIPYQYKSDSLRVKVVNPQNIGISNVKVTLKALDSAFAQGITDHAGIVRFQPKNGHYLITATLNDTISTSVKVAVSSDTLITIKLINPCRVLVKVTNDNGTPVKYATITFLGNTDTVSYGLTDRNGIFLTNIFAGNYLLRISKGGYLTYENTVNLTSDDTINVMLTYTSVIQSSNVKIYPNPTSDKLTIEGAQGSTLKIYQINGKLILHRAINSDKYEIHLKNLPRGIYIIKLQTRNGTLNQKLIKQ